MVKIILASKSKVRKQILDDHNIYTEVKNSYLDEDIIKSLFITLLSSLISVLSEDILLIKYFSDILEASLFL